MCKSATYRLALLTALALCLLGGTAVHGMVITVDLTQSGTESGSHIAGDTWRWGGTNPGTFDLEFSSGQGSNIDLDGGSKAGSEYYTGSEATSNHTYDVIRATYLVGNKWSVEAIRGSTTYWLGTVREFSGSDDHDTAYNYTSSEAYLLVGPADAGADSSTPASYKGWFWIYRDTTDSSVSLQFLVGSGVNTTLGDSGQFRAEFDFGGDYTGTAAIIRGNENNELSVDGSDSTQFNGDFKWLEKFDDGGVIGGITPTATVPEPGTWALFGLGSIVLVFHRRRRRVA